MKIQTSIIGLSFAALLTACGGSSDSTSSNADSNQGGSGSNPADAAFFESIAGVYYSEDEMSLLRINSNGKYITVDLDNDEGAIGIELGQFSRTSTNQIAAKITKDLQVNCWNETRGAGFGNNDDSEKPVFSLEENGKLRIATYKKPSEYVEFNALVADGLVGSWAVSVVDATDEDKPFEFANAATSTEVPQFYFLPSGKYIALFPDEDEQGESFGAGSYSHDEDEKTITISYNLELTSISDETCKSDRQGKIRQGELTMYDVSLDEQTIIYKLDDVDEANNIEKTETITLVRIQTKLD